MYVNQKHCLSRYDVKSEGYISLHVLSKFSKDYLMGLKNKVFQGSAGKFWELNFVGFSEIFFLLLSGEGAELLPCMRFEVLMVVSINLWFSEVCNFADRFQCVGGTCCLFVKGSGVTYLFHSCLSSSFSRNKPNTVQTKIWHVYRECSKE